MTAGTCSVSSANSHVISHPQDFLPSDSSSQVDRADLLALMSKLRADRESRRVVDLPLRRGQFL